MSAGEATVATGEVGIAAPSDLGRAVALTAAAILLLAGLTLVGLVFVPLPPNMLLAGIQAKTQDVPVAIGVAAVLVGLAGLGGAAWVGAIGRAAIGHPRKAVAAMAVAVVVVSTIGCDLVFLDTPLSRDETLATFDAATLARGHLIAPVAPEHRGEVDALQPTFMVVLTDDAGFVSQYLPGNAAIRALVGRLADPRAASPLLAALAVVAVFAAGRRLWPGRIDAALVAALLTATSSQVLITAATPYAMTAHLALDALWLALFLRDDRIGHAGALAVGFLATGLHQIVFHPLFVAPFVIAALRSPERRRVGVFYVVGYGAIGAFWMVWWTIATVAEGMSLTTQLYAEKRMLVPLIEAQIEPAVLMLGNLLRFVVWQNPLTVPLVVLAIPAIRRREGIAGELAAGFAAMAILLVVIMPYQGHGWGFRYFHGLIGSLALLAGHGWMVATTGTGRSRAAAMLTAATVAALVVQLPIQAAMAHAFHAPNARAIRAVREAPFAAVIVDKTDVRFGDDLVRNDPFLERRPLVYELTNLTSASLAKICAAGPVGVFDRRHGRRFGLLDGSSDRKAARRAELRAEMERMGCGVALAIDGVVPR